VRGIGREPFGAAAGGSPMSAPHAMRPRSVKVELSPAQVQLITRHMMRNPTTFFEVAEVRNLIAAARIQDLKLEDVRVHPSQPRDGIKNVIEYNMTMLKSSQALERPSKLINPLMSIDLISTRRSELKVLTIGPRTEAELFALLAAGFSPGNVRGLDLFSYSDFVDVGDMHEMPYPDRTFDVVILGWVLAYSKDNPKAVREVLRVSAPGAFVAVGCQYLPLTNEDLKKMEGDGFLDATRFWTTDDILKLFAGDVDRVIFRHDIHPAVRHQGGDLMVIFQLKV
jgi:SAM-dependent methyltransferase